MRLFPLSRSQISGGLFFFFLRSQDACTAQRKPKTTASRHQTALIPGTVSCTRSEICKRVGLRGHYVDARYLLFDEAARNIIAILTFKYICASQQWLFFLIDAEEAAHFIHWCTQRAAVIDYQSVKRYQYSITVTSSRAAHLSICLLILVSEGVAIKGMDKGGKKADSQD